MLEQTMHATIRHTLLMLIALAALWGGAMFDSLTYEGKRDSTIPQLTHRNLELRPFAHAAYLTAGLFLIATVTSITLSIKPTKTKKKED